MRARGGRAAPWSIPSNPIFRDLIVVFAEPPRTQGDLNFAIFGIPVRVHPMFWLITVLLGLGASQDDPRSMLLWVVAVFISILVHELGHALAIRAQGWQPWITLYGMGGLASYQPTHRRPGTQIPISLAGPAAGFLLAALIMAVLRLASVPVMFELGGPMGVILGFDGEALGRPQLATFIGYLLYINVAWGLLNLLPIDPLDGGHVFRALMTMVRPRDALRFSLTVSMFTAGVMAMYVLTQTRSIYLPLLFAYFAYNNYAALQSFSGGGWR